MENKCNSLKEWVDVEKEGECRPCGIAALVADYQILLEEKGLAELSQGINKALLDDKDPIGAVAVEMDRIKTVVPPDLGLILGEKDCEAQRAVSDNKDG
jgi:hypothetical protein